MNLYKEIFLKLEDAAIRYMVVGGVAVNLYGYSRFTGDIDILLALDLENLEKLDVLMKSLGYQERQPISIKDLADPKKAEVYLKEKGMRAFTYVSSEMPHLDIDVMVSESERFDDFEKNETVVEVWGMKLPVVSIDDLIGMKKKSNREKDIMDVEALLKLKSL